MSEENVAVVREQFEAVNRRDWERAMELYADDVELVSGAGGVNPGVYNGKDAVGEWFGDWMRTFTERHFELIEMHDGGDRVGVVARHSARGRGSGVEVKGDFFYVYDVRDGKVARVEFLDSRDTVLEAIGLG